MLTVIRLSLRTVLLLITGVSLSADGRPLALEQRPYATLASSNVFRLKSPPLQMQPTPVAQPPPKIALLGIVVISPAPKQVMLRVAGDRPGTESSLTINEGEHAEGIEIIEINEQTGVVRLRNRGQLQILSLEQDGLKPGAGLSPATSNIKLASSVETRLQNHSQAARPPSTEPLSPKAQMILMEANRTRTADQVERGLLPPIPSTPLTGK